jgi:seryl-tRNA synthetase
MEATLEESEDATKATKDLQAKAEALAEEHKTNLLRSVDELREMTSIQQEVSSLEESLKRGAARLDEIRKRFPNQPLLAANTHDTGNADPMF